MREQLLDLNFLDTGKYQAMVIQDPENKRKYPRLFSRRPSLFSTHDRTQYRRIFAQRWRRHFDVAESARGADLVDAMNEYTNIHADFSQPAAAEFQGTNGDRGCSFRR